MLEDLDELKTKAKKSGANRAGIIQAGDISLSPGLLDRTRARADYPSIHWPACYPRDDFEPALRAYQAGILFGVEVDPDMPDYGGGPIVDPLHVKSYRLVYELTALIESACFYRGYHLALGLAAGNCRGRVLRRGKILPGRYQGSGLPSSVQGQAFAGGHGSDDQFDF